MEKIKVLHLREGRKLYGAEKVVLNLAANINSNKFNVALASFVYAPNDTNELLEAAEGKNIKTFHINMKHHFDIMGIFRLRQLLKKYSPNILHCHAYKSNIYAFFAAIGLKVKIIATCHGWTAASFRVKVYEFLDSVLLGFFDKVIFVSDITAKQQRPIFISSVKSDIIHNGIEFNENVDDDRIDSIKKSVSRKDGNIIIGSVGRLSREKGYEDLLLAFSFLKKKHLKIKLLIIGEGKLKDYLVKVATHLKIGNDVVFTGFVNDVNNYLGAIDIFVLSSYTEGMPIALLEAMYMSKPIVATAVGGVQKIIKDKVNGILVQPACPQKLAEKIELLITNKEMAVKIGREAKKEAKKKYSVGVMVSQYENLYENIITRS